MTMQFNFRGRGSKNGKMRSRGLGVSCAQSPTIEESIVTAMTILAEFSTHVWLGDTPKDGSDRVGTDDLLLVEAGTEPKIAEDSEVTDTTVALTHIYADSAGVIASNYAVQPYVGGDVAPADWTQYDLSRDQGWMFVIKQSDDATGETALLGLWAQLIGGGNGFHLKSNDYQGPWSIKCTATATQVLQWPSWSGQTALVVLNWDATAKQATARIRTNADGWDGQPIVITPFNWAALPAVTEQFVALGGDGGAITTTLQNEPLSLVGMVADAQYSAQNVDDVWAAANTPLWEIGAFEQACRDIGAVSYVPFVPQQYNPVDGMLTLDTIIESRAFTQTFGVGRPVSTYPVKSSAIPGLTGRMRAYVSAASWGGFYSQDRDLTIYGTHQDNTYLYVYEHDGSSGADAYWRNLLQDRTNTSAASMALIAKRNIQPADTLGIIEPSPSYATITGITGMVAGEVVLFVVSYDFSANTVTATIVSSAQGKIGPNTATKFTAGQAVSALGLRMMGDSSVWHPPTGYSCDHAVVPAVLTQSQIDDLWTALGV